MFGRFVRAVVLPENVYLLVSGLAFTSNEFKEHRLRRGTKLAPRAPLPALCPAHSPALLLAPGWPWHPPYFHFHCSTFTRSCRYIIAQHGIGGCLAGPAHVGGPWLCADPQALCGTLCAPTPAPSMPPPAPFLARSPPGAFPGAAQDGSRVCQQSWGPWRSRDHRV